LLNNPFKQYFYLLLLYCRKPAPEKNKHTCFLCLGKLTNKKSFKCIICPKMKPCAPLLKRHEGFCLDQKKMIECAICKMDFTRSVYLNSHIQTVHNKKAFSCEVCGNVFASDRSVRRHQVQFHRDLLKKRCEFCELWLLNEEQLDRHSRLNTNCKIKYLLKA
jgi:hypothetical protein